MNGDSSSCPEDSNSTDCLLRTLIQLVRDQNRADNAEYNWDPLTFVFTAIIGVTAILFALIPVVQAFLTAGRANRKSSKRAIGQWAAKRKRLWNKSEWTINFVIDVPILRVDNLLPNMEKMEKGEGIAAAIQEIQTPEIITRRQDQTERTAATWPTFFRRVGLDEVALNAVARDGVALDEFGATITPTMFQSLDVGFLPDDLVATPAYAEVRVIISSAAMTPDAHTLFLDEKSGYPVIIGTGFQFEFRQHPLLGLVGAFLPFDTEKCDAPKSTQLKEALQHARGIVQFDDNTISSPFNGYDWRRSTVNLPKEGIDDINEFVLNAFESASQATRRFFYPEDWMLNKYNVPLASLFLTKAPQHVPAIFLISELGFNYSLIPLALSGAYWAEYLDVMGEVDRHRRRDTQYGYTPEWQGFVWSGKIREGFDARQEEEEAHSTSFYNVQSRPQSPVGSQWGTDMVEGNRFVLRMCLDLLLYPGKIARSFGKAYIGSLNPRRLALDQLREVDRWLAARRRDSEGRRTVNTHASRICTTTMLLMEAIQVMHDGSLGRPMQPENQDAFSHAISGSGSIPTTQRLKEHQDHVLDEHREGRSTMSDKVSWVGTLRSLRQILDAFNISDSTLRSSSDKSATALKLQSSTRFTLRRNWLNAAANGTDSGSLRSPEDETAVFHRFEKNLESFDTQLRAILGTGYNAPERYFSTHQALDRLGEVMVYNSKDDHDWPLWNRHRRCKEDRKARELDDVIIYRCLLVALLFRTALDSSEILKSNLWEQVVPIL